MNPYSAAKIYRIDSLAGGVCYIGSTTRPLHKRFRQHKAHRIGYVNGKANFVSSFDVLEHGDAVISLVEDFPCDSKAQLSEREAHHIRRQTEGQAVRCVNKVIPGRSAIEWYQDNRERLVAQANQYRADNLDECKARVRQYNRTHKEEIDRKGAVPHTCPTCGTTVKTRNISIHQRSKKHREAEAVGGLS